LALTTLKFGAGLPAGVAELEMIERARVKRAWEAALPKVTDKESFHIRLRMMEEMELREWQQRELEIKKYQFLHLAIRFAYRALFVGCKKLDWRFWRRLFENVRMKMMKFKTSDSTEFGRESFRSVIQSSKKYRKRKSKLFGNSLKRETRWRTKLKRET
jgi:hypothetical protein